MGKAEIRELCEYTQNKGGIVVFYDKYVQLCNKHNVSKSKAAVEAGLSKSTVSKWKTNPDAKPTGAAIAKLTDYFGITVAELLGEEKEKTATNGGDLSAEELDFIRLYSEADEQKKAAIKILLGM